MRKEFAVLSALLFALLLLGCVQDPVKDAVDQVVSLNEKYSMDDGAAAPEGSAFVSYLNELSMLRTNFADESAKLFLDAKIDLLKSYQEFDKAFAEIKDASDSDCDKISAAKDAMRNSRDYSLSALNCLDELKEKHPESYSVLEKTGEIIVLDYAQANYDIAQDFLSQLQYTCG